MSDAEKCLRRHRLIIGDLKNAFVYIYKAASTLKKEQVGFEFLSI